LPIPQAAITKQQEGANNGGEGNYHGRDPCRYCWKSRTLPHLKLRHQSPKGICWEKLIVANPRVHREKSRDMASLIHRDADQVTQHSLMRNSTSLVISSVDIEKSVFLFRPAITS
jgi:hypothetical protein